jgi:aspartate-semialdehyde dehydrogenase
LFATSVTGSSLERLEMPLPQDSLRVAIAGAASLRGQDLKAWMEESGFPAGEVRLFEEEPLAGTLTGVAGEAAVIQSIEEGSFDGLQFIFFAGSRAFAREHGLGAARAGATVIDLTGELAQLPGAALLIPRLDELIRPTERAAGTDLSGRIRVAPSAPAIVACSFAWAVAEFKPARVVINFFQPVSERGRAGIEELEGQTTKLLSLQPMPQEVFDCQVAFNMLDRWGAESAERLADARSAIVREVQAFLSGRVLVPALTLIQAPVFYGYAFSAYAEFSQGPDMVVVQPRLRAAGFKIAAEDEPGASNLGAAGESQAIITGGERDPGVPQGYWFWGAADNLRLATSNATQIAEKILVL